MDKPKEKLNGMRDIEVERGFQFVDTLMQTKAKVDICYDYAQRLCGLTNGEIAEVKKRMGKELYERDCKADM